MDCLCIPSDSGKWAAIEFDKYVGCIGETKEEALLNLAGYLAGYTEIPIKQFSKPKFYLNLECYADLPQPMFREFYTAQ